MALNSKELHILAGCPWCKRTDKYGSPSILCGFGSKCYEYRKMIIYLETKMKQ